MHTHGHTNNANLGTTLHVATNNYRAKRKGSKRTNEVIEANLKILLNTKCEM